MYKVVFLDLCGTLVKENTTFDFFNKMILPEKSFLLRAVWKSKFVQLVTKILTVCHIKYDMTKKSCLFMMRGHTEGELRSLAKSYMSTLTWRRDILYKVEKLVQHGYKPVIVSASLPFLVEVVSNHLMISAYISSEMEYEDGIFTGRLLTDLQGNKLEALANKNVDKSIFITDNLDDISCKDVVNYFIAVTNAKNRAYWKENKVLIHVV